MDPTILLYRDDEGYKCVAYSKIDDWHAGHTVVPSRGHPDTCGAYIGGIAALNRAWEGRLEIKAGVPDDADRSKHPLPLDEILLADIRKRI